MSTDKQEGMTIDLTILDNEPMALARITAALAEVYFAHVLDKRQDKITPIGEAYTMAFRLCPNYRLIVQNEPGFERYKHLNPEIAVITSLPINQTK